MRQIAFLICAAATMHAGTLALLCSESGDTTCGGVVSLMQATGDFSSVVGFDTTSSTPTLAQIGGYNSVLAWTDSPPNDSIGLGNLLASYYALGGKALTIATYAFSNPWEINGTVMTGAYSALVNNGTNGNVSGNLVAVVPADPIFNGINLSSVVYGFNGNYAHPTLAGGATLLATDGSGVDMIARSSNGVIDVNVWPANFNNNAELYDLLANTLTGGASAAPEPSTFAFMGVGIGALLIRRVRSRRKVA